MNINISYTQVIYVKVLKRFQDYQNFLEATKIKIIPYIILLIIFTVLQ